MGVTGFEINVNSASVVLNYGGNSFSSYTVPSASRPFLGNALNSRVARKVRISHARKLKVEPVSALSNGGSNAGLISDGLIPKELEFKPSFDEYLKAMESSRTVRGKEHAVATTQKQKTREKNMATKPRREGDEVNKKFQRVVVKIEEKDGFESDNEDGALNVVETTVNKEGSSTSNGKVRGTPTKGFENKYDGKGSSLSVKIKQKQDEKVRVDRMLKHRSHSLEPDFGDSSMIKSQGKRGSGRISNDMNNNNRSESVIEGEVVSDLYSSMMAEEKVVSIRHRDYKARAKAPVGDNIVASQKVMDRGIGRRHTGSASIINRNGKENVKLNGSSKLFIDRGYDSDELEVERAAFKNLEDFNGVISKPQISHKEKEERIQKLAKLYAARPFFLAMGYLK